VSTIFKRGTFASFLTDWIGFSVAFWLIEQFVDHGLIFSAWSFGDRSMAIYVFAGLLWFGAINIVARARTQRQ
jgi:hypothetical protein